ncbi:MAG: transcription antitermination factor NusB [Candidatus Nanopelagicaceae bacterium]|nr:transcription antitermination factor NusB [Actinomycetota bacterium]NCV43433.1 transcription antitermination factor NusB [Actinomycetota bacterium]NCV83260.1 transcription antitermination factor NusB [Actinomycetota bacterium]NCW46603.1 transcription antitermination factor NusB [Actinomycetota bacterium]NCW75394.1 transcription antitermination factor NusB [Actinomycetota bacterium]
MSARSKARKAALDFLYEGDIRGKSASSLLGFRKTELDFLIRDYTEALVNGVEAKRDRIDEIISMRAKDWDLDRMPVVDRNILRVGVFELLWGEQIPEEVAISESVELAKTLSTEDSATYINGVLAAIREIKKDLSL